jgi:hypothetical protein
VTTEARVRPPTEYIRNIFAACLLLASVVGCESGADPAPYPECVPDKEQFACVGGEKWAECLVLDPQGKSCKEDATPCMGCNMSVGNFTCGCRDDRTRDAGPTWQCGGTGKTCRSSDGT